MQTLTAGLGLKPQHYERRACLSQRRIVVRSASRELHGRRRTAPRVARRAARTPSAVVARRRVVAGRRLRARSSAPRAARHSGRSLRAGAGVRAPGVEHLGRRLPARPAAGAAHAARHCGASSATSRRCRIDCSRPIALENPSHYLAFDEHEFDELGFLVEIARRSGCTLLLDVNNVYVSANNLGYRPEAVIDAVPAGLITEVHLAGHSADPALGTAAADRQSRRAGRAGRVVALRAADRPHRCAADTDRARRTHPGLRRSAGRTRARAPTDAGRLAGARPHDHAARRLSGCIRARAARRRCEQCSPLQSLISLRNPASPSTEIRS